MNPSVRSDYDVVIVDATPGGIAGAIAAARAGCSVALVTEDKVVGGMQTSGLGNTNAGLRATVGGLAREFHERIERYYVDRYGPDAPQVRDCDGGFYFEPHVALAVYDQWLAEADVTCLRQAPLTRVDRVGNRLTRIHTANGLAIAGRIFIDASYEGDLLALAGCSYHLGRESSATYGESLAGVRYPPASQGQADGKLQPFDYRLCLCDDPANRVPVAEPEGYDPGRYAYHAAVFRHRPPTLAAMVLPLNMMPNRKTDSRTGEWVGASWAWPEADRATRARIARAHRQYSHGYLWFAMTDPSVPAQIREELGRWGFARDEFADNDHWPYHIYVREARRLVGDDVMTQRDVTDDRHKPDAVGLGSFYLDVHPVQMVPEPGAVGGFVPEGDLAQHAVFPYEIPYRALLAKRGEADNLLTPVCLSASHVAFSTIRMEPVWMVLGHAAGVAAAMSLEHEVPLHGLATRTLQQRLTEQGQIIDARPFAGQKVEC